MKQEELTFNDLPAVVGELCNRITSMENLLTEKLSKQHEVKENTHVPMTVQEACAYLKCRYLLSITNQKGRYSSYQTRKTSLYLSRRTG